MLTRVQGGPTGAIIAYKNPSVQVVVADVQEARIQAWLSDRLPLHEPGLEDIVARTVRGTHAHPMSSQNLYFTTDVTNSIAQADIVLICVNTPTKAIGSGAGSASDLAFVEAACLDIAEASRSNKIIVEKSTVPVRTADMVRTILSSAARPDVKFEVLSNPEFLSEGTAIHDLSEPDRVLIGSMPSPSGMEAAGRLADLYSWIPRHSIMHTDVWSSELAKLASNAFLAQRISSINSLSAICEATGANIEEVARIVGADSRIGSKMLKSSVGFGGSCFRKDILSLCYLAQSLHLPEVAAYWRGVLTINTWQKERFVSRMLVRLNNTLTSKTVGILGFAYKKNTSDARESPAIATIRSLIFEGATVQIYDPKVTPSTIYSELRAIGVTESELNNQVKTCATALDAGRGANAIAILTDWDEFGNMTNRDSLGSLRIDSCDLSSPEAEQAHLQGRSMDDIEQVEDSPLPIAERTESLNGSIGCNNNIRATDSKLCWASMAKLMKRPCFVLDGRNVVDAKKLRQYGLHVESIGIHRNYAEI